MKRVEKYAGEDIVYKNDVFIIPKGEVYEGNITVKGGVLIIKGVLRGNIVVLRGKVKVTGRVEGLLISIYSKVFLSADIDNVILIYSDVIFDGGIYNRLKMISCRFEVLRKIKVQDVIRVNGPLLSMYLAIVFGYALSFL